MRSCVIIYHKNINKIYQKQWIDQCIDSIKDQSYKDYYVYDLNYGTDDFNFSQHFNPDRYQSYQHEFENHVGAMNFLLDRCCDDQFDAVFNINLDDWYHPDRFKIQIDKIEDGYDIVSSNFNIFKINIHGEWKLTTSYNFSSQDIKSFFNGDINIVAHPCVCYSKNFISKNRYLNEIPKEDFNLWKRTIDTYKFLICPEFLLNYRVHSNQVTTLSSGTIVEPIFDKQVDQKPQIEVCHYCGHPKNKIRYNFCPKCNRIYR